MQEHHRTAKFLRCSLKSWAALWSMGALCLLCGVARAQDEPEPPKPPSFPLLFKTQTHTNAYEDWVQAGDLIQNNKMVDAASEQGATLTLKRRLLADPTIQQALLLLHHSLDKPVHSPHINIDENTTFPEFSAFRKLARLLSTQMYVCFADGRIDAVMESLSDGLRFGYRMQSDTLISGLVGVAMEAIVLKSFAGHLDQLSDYQCSHLQRFVEEWLDAPSPSIAVFVGEKQVSLRMFDTMRSDVKRLEQLVSQAYSDDENPDADTQALMEHLKTHPQDIGPIIDRARALMAAYCDSAIANLKLPAKERKTLQEFKDKSLGGKLVELLAPTMTGVSEKYDQTQAMMRLLGVHAAIRRYKWEHNFLPKSLADLHVGHLTEDPFTGDSMVYQIAGTGYDLYSKGPIQKDEKGKSLATRKSVRLP